MTISFSPNAIKQLSCILTSAGCATTLSPSATAEAVHRLIDATSAAQRLRARRIDQHLREIQELGQTLQDIDRNLSHELEG